MLLTGRQIYNKFIAEGGHEKHIREASYDLTIGQILVDGEEKKFRYNLDPQETIFVVSKEVIEIDNYHLAYANPKTGLTYEGLLALSTGLIDPKYKGLISSAIINFDAEEKTIKIGDPFLRITAHEFNKKVNAEVSGESNRVYIEMRTNDSERFPNTFLDIDRNVNEFQNRVLDKYERKTTNRMLLWLTILGIIFTAANYFINQDFHQNRDQQIYNTVRKQLDAHTRQHRLIEAFPITNAKIDSLIKVLQNNE